MPPHPHPTARPAPWGLGSPHFAVIIKLLADQSLVGTAGVLEEGKRARMRSVPAEPAPERTPAPAWASPPLSSTCQLEGTDPGASKTRAGLLGAPSPAMGPWVINTRSVSEPQSPRQCHGRDTIATSGDTVHSGCRSTHTALPTVLPGPRRGAPGGQLLRSGKWRGTLGHALLGTAQPRLPAQGPDPRHFPPCLEERDNVPGGGEPGSGGGYVLKRACGPGAGHSQPGRAPCPGPPAILCRCVQLLLYGHLAKEGPRGAGNTSPGPWCAAAIFSNSPKSLPKPWLRACCQRPSLLASSQGQCAHVPADRPVLSDGPAPVPAQGHLILYHVL